MPLEYPKARRDNIVEDYHGTPVADPYRWLEDPDSPETQAFTTAQNEFFQSFIAADPNQAKIKASLAKFWDYPQFGEIKKKKEFYFFTKNDGSHDQPLLYKQRGLEGDPEVLLDPNTLSEDGTIALISQYYSKDGGLLAYGLSSGGSDWLEIKVRDTQTGQDLPDLIRHTKFTSVAWKHDSSGFFYNRMPEPGSVPEEESTFYATVYWHQLGTSQKEDILVYEDRQNKEHGFYPFMDDDGKWLLMGVFQGTDIRNGLYVKALEGESEWLRLIEVQEARFDFIGNLSTTFYFITDLDAPRSKIIAVDLNNPGREHWQEIIPEAEDPIDFCALVNRQLVVVTKHHAHHQVHLYQPDGAYDRQVELPTLGSVLLLSGGREDEEVFLVFTSFTMPPTLLRYDFNSGQAAPFQPVETVFNPDDYETTQVFYPSKDGTQIPMFLTHKKGLDLKNDNPTLLYGYGGFNISITPFFFLPRVALLEQGWVYAVANLRGGDEYGEDWHQAGMLEKKQNVFDDFIAAAEYLVAEGITSTPKLAIEGRSNGGLLTAACLTQRPDLYGAVLVVVPVIDMLRYHRFTVGRYWTPEYGNAEEDPEHFKFMFAYSPLHNVDPDADYPPTLILSADTDDRVVPAHAKKFAAALQHEAPGENPALIRIETRAGHGLGKPISKLIQENGEIFTFLYKVLGLEWD